MVAKAEAKYIRISPYKVRQITQLLKGEKVTEALNVLSAMNKKGAYHLRKVLHSAVANAKSKGHEEEALIISRMVVNAGPMLKRWRAASFGRATMIRKKTSHILVELDTIQKLIEGVKIK